MEIRKAKTFEYESVRRFYYDLIDHVDQLEYKPGWMKGVYPADQYLLESIQEGELFIGLRDGSIVTAMIVNNSGNESYKTGQWMNTLSEEQYYVIHALGVDPSLCRTGLAKEMVRFVFRYARDNNMEAVRLDVLAGNLSAERLYETLGFVHTDTIRMYYEDTGWTDFLLYEYSLKEETVSN